VLSGAGEPALRQLVLPAPDPVEFRRELEEAPGVVPPCPTDLERAGDGLPERRENDVVLGKDKRQADGVHEGGRLLERLYASGDGHLESVGAPAHGEVPAP
jgi:hypothetical protein